MKCISCETEINPKWKNAIDTNSCPFCGKIILEEHLKNCLASLGSAMEAMLKYPEQLDDWMLSNHNYIKTDSLDLKNFISKETVKELRKEIDDEEFQDKKQSVIKIKTPDGGTQDVLVEKTQSKEKTNGFFDRAEVLKGSGKTSGKAVKGPAEPEVPKSVVEKTQHLREIAQKIRSEASEGIINEAGLASMIQPSEIGDADPATVAQLQSAIESGDIISSGLQDMSSGDDDDEIHPAALAMAARANKNKNSNGANDKDLQSLYEMQNKVQGAQKRLASGRGGFSRS